MRDWRYLLSISLITTLILAIGGFVWNSGIAELSSGKIEFTDSPWPQGPEEAPIKIDMYTDFG